MDPTDLNTYLDRAHLLIEQEQYQEAYNVLRPLAEQYDTQATAPRPYYYGNDIEAAEMGAQLLMGMTAIQIMGQFPPSQIQRDVDRLIALGKCIKKRYEAKIAILLHITHVLHHIGQDKEAHKHLRDARRYYDQQLARYEGTPLNDIADGLRAKLDDLTADLESTTYTETIRFTIQAESRHDLDRILATLTTQAGELKITRRNIETRTSDEPRAGSRFSASLRLTLQAGAPRRKER